MTDTWKQEALIALTAAATASEPMPTHERDELGRKLREPLAAISTLYPKASAGDNAARYAILDACDDINTTLAAHLGPDWTPPTDTIGAKLIAAANGI